MADYKFKKPWAAESQNVKTFTEEEWGTGIVEKSLVSSSQVNGVMQQVTSRFLELEAVEDRQFRYDFIVDDELSFQKFIAGDFGNSKSILFRTGKWQTEEAVDLSKKDLLLIRLESTALVNLCGGCVFSNVKPQIQSGHFQEAINYTNAIFNGVHFSSYNYTFVNSYIINSTLYSASIGKFSGGIFQNCRIIIDYGTITNATFTDCKFEQSPAFENCTLIRCIIPNNIKLTNCTVIDCDYTVNAYKANLVTGTTFRNCDVTISIRESSGNIIVDEDTNFRNCKLMLDTKVADFVNGSAYDCEFKGGDNNISLSNKLHIFGNSYMIVHLNSTSAFESITSKMKYSHICTDTPFYRKLQEYRYYVYEVESASDLIPGAINSVSDTRDRNLKTSTTGNSYFVRFKSRLSGGAIVYFGGVLITPSEQINTNGYIKLIL